MYIANTHVFVSVRTKIEIAVLGLPGAYRVLQDGVRKRSDDVLYERVVHQATVRLGPQHAVDLPLLCRCEEHGNVGGRAGEEVSQQRFAAKVKPSQSYTETTRDSIVI